MNKWVLAVVLLVPPVASSPVRGQSRDRFEQVRAVMVEETIRQAGVRHPRVLDAMRATPRHEFVPREHWKEAYEDMALPIGDQQTISSPFIVAFMTESLDPQPGDRVLEIGTGSGYQAAILSPLVKDVFTIEIVEPLGRRAERTLNRLRYENVRVKVGDGFLGWPEFAPFDKIIVTCSPEEVPQPLVDQLREDGLMVIPVGERYQQTLYVLRKKEGKLVTESMRPTLFVPMTGAAEDARAVQPDPANPRLANGNFEQPLLENGFVPGWYYQRNLTWHGDTSAPEGKHFVGFRNQVPGRRSHLLQGMAVDGRQVAYLEMTAWVRYDQVERGRDPAEAPILAVTFYDEHRKTLGMRWIGPFLGTEGWMEKRELVRVPAQAREAIVRIGLFGAVGEICFDDIRLVPHARTP